MYLWLKLIFDVLQQQLKTTEKHLLRVIDELPETVDQAYEAVLNRIPKNEVERAKKLLAIVLVAGRPPHVQELNIALAIDEDPTQDSLSGLDMETESSFRSRLGNVCGSFVTVVDSRVYLIHQTARSFLSSIKKRIRAWLRVPLPDGKAPYAYLRLIFYLAGFMSTIYSFAILSGIFILQ